MKRVGFGLLRRLECRSALSVPAWLVAFGPSISTAVLHDRNLYGGSLLMWMFAALVGMAAAGLVMVAGSALLRGRRPVGVLLAVFALAGAARGIGVGASAMAFGLVPDPQLLVRATSGAILALFWLSIATVVVDGFRRHRRAREELDLSVLQAEQDLIAAHRDLQDVRERARIDVITDVRHIARTLAALPAMPAEADLQLRTCAARLHDLASTVVRPISHQAVSEQRQEDFVPARRGVAYRAIALDAVTVDPFRPDWLVLLLFPSILMTAIRAYGVLPGTLGAMSIVLLAALVLLAARRGVTPRLHRWTPYARFPVVVFVWVLAAVAAAAPVAISSGWAISPDRSWEVFGVPLLAYVPITCIGIAIGTAIASAWALDEDSRASRVESLTWQARRDEQLAWAERRKWGRFLHGSVQSTLTSTALLIDTQLRQNHKAEDVAQQALARLESLLLVSSELPEESVDVDDVLHRIVDLWSRVATVELHLDSGARACLARDAAAAEKSVEIVREGLANAIRHGRAREVRVALALEESGVLDITIDDDGVFTSPTAAGMGSQLLDELCRDWQRSRTAQGGTLLQCRIATHAAQERQPA